MSKAIFEFDLNDPDDLVSFKRTSKALDMAFVLFQFGNNTKKGFEWSLDKFETKEDLLDAIYEKFWELMKENNVNIEEILD